VFSCLCYWDFFCKVHPKHPLGAVFYAFPNYSTVHTTEGLQDPQSFVFFLVETSRILQIFPHHSPFLDLWLSHCCKIESKFASRIVISNCPLHLKADTSLLFPQKSVPPENSSHGCLWADTTLFSRYASIVHARDRESWAPVCHGIDTANPLSDQTHFTQIPPEARTWCGEFQHNCPEVWWNYKRLKTRPFPLKYRFPMPALATSNTVLTHERLCLDGNKSSTHILPAWLYSHCFTAGGAGGSQVSTGVPGMED